MCVAAMTLDDRPEWIRLHPIPFRDLEDDSRFKKYQEIDVHVIRPSADRRPESWTPQYGTLRLGRTVGTKHGWSARRERVAALGKHTMCALNAANAGGSGLGVPSLAVVQAASPPELVITKRAADQVTTWQERADAIAARPSLFDDPDKPRHAFEVVPWRFQYRYRCLANGCHGHQQPIIDWEILTLWRKVRHDSDWQELVKAKFEDEMWAVGRDSVLFVGNQVQHPQSFLVLSVFWPPRQPLQPVLLS